MAEAGYSGTPQARKLGLKAGHRLCLDHPPRGWRVTDRPDGVTTVRAPAPADVIISFCRAAHDLPGRLEDLAPRIFPAGMLWIAWPRKAAGHVSDLTDNVVRQAALPLGLVDVKVAALDEDWSALKFVWRREERARPAR